MNSQITPIKNPTVKLDDDQRKQVALLLAAMVPVPQIVKKIKEDWGITIGHEKVRRYIDAPRWKNFIINEREKFLADMQGVPIFHPKIRVMRYEEMYQRGSEKGQESVMSEALKLATTELKKSESNTFQFNQFNMNMTMEEIKAKKEVIFKKLAQRKELSDGPSWSAKGEIPQ